MRVTACQSMVGALLAAARTPVVGRRDEPERTVGRESVPLAGLPASAQTPAGVRWPRVQAPARPWAECRRRAAVETSPDARVSSQVEVVPPPVKPKPRSAAALEPLGAPETLTAPLALLVLMALMALMARKLLLPAVSQV